MRYTFTPPVPAEQIRQLPTRDVAILLLQHLAGGTGFLQYAGTMGSARQAFQDEPDAENLVDRLSDAWAWLEAHALLSRVPSQSEGFRQLSPVKTRDMAPPGFHRALAAHQAVPRVQHVSSGVTEAIERQNRAMRELSRRAFPEPDAAPDDAPASMNDARLQRRRQAAATEAAALRRARAEKADRPMAAPQQLERTA
ncbi:hypothetical protein ACVV2G_27555 [Streptomyces ziwulingensis]